MDIRPVRYTMQWFPLHSSWFVHANFFLKIVLCHYLCGNSTPSFLLTCSSWCSSAILKLKSPAWMYTDVFLCVDMTFFFSHPQFAPCVMKKYLDPFISLVFSSFMLIRNLCKKNTDSKQWLRVLFDQAFDWRLFWTHITHGRKKKITP